MPNTPIYGRGQVIEIINSVLSKVDMKQNLSRDVYAHLAELAEIIDTLKRDISSAQPGQVKVSHIPDATDELGEVVKATAEATNKIMTICEEIEGIAQGIEPPAKDDITGKVTQIYEACGFQDITGQRIKNVVGTLQLIEGKIDKIMETLGEAVGYGDCAQRHEKHVSVDDAQSLLNGPQMADKAISQDDIDKLLADFDK